MTLLRLPRIELDVYRPSKYTKASRCAHDPRPRWFVLPWFRVCRLTFPPNPAWMGRLWVYFGLRGSFFFDLAIV
jgi:quinol-cytochrome oxidoreductase complex cytochrome b subunit